MQKCRGFFLPLKEKKMENRDTFLNSFRGETLGTVSTQSSAEEIFQNQTLRPILKLQNDLLVQVFINYAIKQKGDFFGYTPEKKVAYVENAIQRDIKFRNSLKGIVIGLFSVNEYQEYTQNSSNLNKRMMTMLVERLKNQIQILVRVQE
ncbi:MAG: hypothetical protein ACI9XR_000380 [Flavobacterium sp.]